jgi:hypothetical protein
MLLGTELYQSFFMTKICYQVLPRSAFHTLQKKVFPVYFALQSSLVLLLIFTYPPYSVVSLIKSTFDLTTFTIAGAVAFLNYFVYGPATSAAMMDRIHQGKPCLMRSVPILMMSCVLIWLSSRNSGWSEEQRRASERRDEAAQPELLETACYEHTPQSYRNYRNYMLRF